MMQVEHQVKYVILFKTYPYIMKVTKQCVFDLVQNNVQNAVAGHVVTQFNDLMLRVGDEDGSQ